MSFNWLHFLDLALKLYEQAGNSKQRDAHLRTSISRAYYATYHQSRQHLKTKEGISVSKSLNAHKQVRSEFKRRKQYRIEENLYRMRGYRNNADYEDTFENLEETAQQKIILAKQVLSCLSRL